MLMQDIDTGVLSIRPSIRRLSVLLSCSTIVTQWLNISSYFLQRIILLVVFPVLNISEKFHPLQRRWIQVGYINFAIWPQLLWNGNRKSYAFYQTVTFSMTLSDFWRSFCWPTLC